MERTEKDLLVWWRKHQGICLNSSFGFHLSGRKGRNQTINYIGAPNVKTLKLGTSLSRVYELKFHFISSRVFRLQSKMGKKTQKGQPLHRQNPKVDEATRIRISQILEEFRASKDEGKAFTECSLIGMHILYIWLIHERYDIRLFLLEIWFYGY